jgi:hypothetical protein
MKIADPRQSGPGAVFVADVHNNEGKLIAQFFGATAEEASTRAKRYMRPGDEGDSNCAGCNAALYGAVGPAHTCGGGM